MKAVQRPDLRKDDLLIPAKSPTGALLDIEITQPVPCWQPDELDGEEYNVVVLINGQLLMVPSIDLDFIDDTPEQGQEGLPEEPQQLERGDLVRVPEINRSGVVVWAGSQAVDVRFPDGLEARFSPSQLSLVGDPDYYASAVRWADENKDAYEAVSPPYSEEELEAIVMWSVYERESDGCWLCIADFTGDQAEENAKAFAELKNNTRR